MNLSDKALLVQLSVSQWTARKYDRKVSEDVAHAHKADTKAGRYNKALMPYATALNAVHTKTAVLRNQFAANTLPWGFDGTRILPVKNYLAFTSDIRKHKTEWEQFVSEFVQSYAALRDEARTQLGDLYNDADYPDVNEIGKKFSVSVAVMPVPTTDFRIEIGDAERAKMKADLEGHLADATKGATKEIWSRLHKRVSRIAEVLADNKGRLHDVLFENMTEDCELAHRMNLTDCPKLSGIVLRIQSVVTYYHPDAIKSDPTLRLKVADDAAATVKMIEDEMGAL